jgi:hypothetical protein
MNHRRFCLLALLAVASLFPSGMDAQEQLGMRLERYAGLYGATLNPAQTAFMPHAWEVSLVHADGFLNNNYAYLRRTSIPQVLRHPDRLLATTDITPERPAPANAILQEFSNRDRRLFAQAQARVGSPAVAFRIADRHVIGISAQIRSVFSAYRIPSVFRYPVISDLPRDIPVELPAVKLAAMGWGEIALHYSQRNDDGDYIKAWGVTPKLLIGLEGAYTRAASSFDYTQQRNDTTAFARARWDYALTTGNANDSGNPQLQRNGGGIAFDLGYSIALPDDEGGYRWRLGASILDAGWVRFRRNAQRHRLDFDNTVRVTDADFPARNQVQDLMEDVSEAFLGDRKASFQSNTFRIGLPTALSLQADVQLIPHLYVAAVWVQRAPLRTHSVRRPNTLAVAPRLEHRWWSLSMPVVLSDYQSLRAGVAARLGVVYLGTDDIGSFLGKKRLTGTDVYLGVKINAFSLHLGSGGDRWRGERHKTPKQKRRQIKCYKFSDE